LFYSLEERIRRGRPIPFPLAALLSAMTPAWRLGMMRRLRQDRQRVDAYVVSFGNITAGGTGKTPGVIERARAEIAAGKRVAVITRGYGAKQGLPPVIVEGVTSLAKLVNAIGDEPALIARRAPGVAIVKCADRVAAARAALRECKSEVLILDDGFQCVALERDEDILVIDATNPFGNGHLVPRGILREPMTHARRATHIVMTRCDQVSNLPALVEQVRMLCPDAPVRLTRHAPTGLWRPTNNEDLPLDMLKGASVRAVCGIGNPEAFFRTLQDLGADLAATMPFRDHSAIPPRALVSDGVIVTTEKDAVRIPNPPENLLALRIELKDMAANS